MLLYFVMTKQEMEYMNSWFFLMKLMQLRLVLFSFILYFPYKFILLIILLPHQTNSQMYTHIYFFATNYFHMAILYSMLFAVLHVQLADAMSDYNNCKFLRIFEMSKDTKQNKSDQHITSPSSLPLLSPSADKNDEKTPDFYNTTNSFLPLQSTQYGNPAQIKNKKCQSLTFISDNLKTSNQSQELGIKPVEQWIGKYQKDNNQPEPFYYIPLATKEKTVGGEEPSLEVPELTAESLISSEQLDMDNESNTTDLPLSSIRRYKIPRVFHQQSEGSDDMHSYQDNKKMFHMKEEYAQSKGSDISESDDFPAICKPCFALIEKCKILQTENAELIKQTQILKEQIVKCQEKSRQQLLRQKQQNEPKQLNLMPPNTIKEYFILQMQQFHKILTKVNALVQNYSIDFRGKQCQMLQKCCKQFKKIDKNILGREAKNERKLQIEQIHNNYKKIISIIVKTCQEKQIKRQADFKKALTTIVKKQESDAQARAFEGKSEKSRKKSKCFIDKQENNEVDFIEQIKINQQNRQKMQWLELNYTREKQRYSSLQNSYQELQERCKTQIAHYLKEKSILKHQIAKCGTDFADFMFKINQNKNKIHECDFFKNLSQRIFEISNCIPFQDNDEQNLFAPENEEQIWDMVERIRRFYLHIEEYNLRRDSTFEAQKSGFILFLKELVQNNKVSSDYILQQMLQNKKYERLHYLKELIQTSRRNLKANIQELPFTQESRILKLQRTKSFTFCSQTQTI